MNENDVKHGLSGQQQEQCPRILAVWLGRTCQYDRVNARSTGAQQNFRYGGERGARGADIIDQGQVPPLDAAYCRRVNHECPGQVIGSRVQAQSFLSLVRAHSAQCMTDFWRWQRELVAKLCDEISGLMKTPTAQCAVAEGDANPSVCVVKQAGDDRVALHQCGEAVP